MIFRWFDVGVCLPLNKRNELNKKKSSQTAKKSKFEPEQILRHFLEKKTRKKIISTYLGSELHSSTLKESV